MNWEEVLQQSRAEAVVCRQQARAKRARAEQCAAEAKTAADLDSGVLWVMRAMQQRSAAASSDAAAETSDRIGDHAERVLTASARQ